VFDGFGVAIISTPKGIVSDKVARKLGQGGEVFMLRLVGGEECLV